MQDRSPEIGLELIDKVPSDLLQARMSEYYEYQPTLLFVSKGDVSSPSGRKAATKQQKHRSSKAVATISKAVATIAVRQPSSHPLGPRPDYLAGGYRAFELTTCSPLTASHST
jgi:hypothetical protein